jgi:dUTP pyrophosphatase
MKEALVRVVKVHPRAVLPHYESEGAAGMDLRAFLDASVSVPPLGRVKIPTGIKLEIPEGMEGQIRPRSGLAVKQGLTVLNSPGTVDSDYRGEIQVILINLGSNDTIIKDGDRIAQLVIAPVCRACLTEVEMLSDSDRGSGGFGSTGS